MTVVAAFSSVLAVAPVPVDPVLAGWLWPLAPLPGLLLWVGLALARARRSDGHFARRMARRRLARLTARLATAGRSPEAGAIEAWCRDCAALLAISRAAPTEAEVTAALAATPEIHDAAAWLTLWRQARAALFGLERRVPDDWPQRAAALVRRTRIKRADPFFPRRLVHWLPRAALVAVLTLGTGADLAAADLPAIPPGDWAGHVERSRALADAGNWPAAQAHATAAFLLAPREAVTRDGLRRLAGETERLDPLLASLLAPGGAARLAAVASPGEWQRLGWFGAVGTMLGFGVLVTGLYRGAAWRRSGVTLLIMAGLAGAGGTWARRVYGLAAEPDAACLARQTDLRDVPSDLVEIRQAAPLAAGTLVRIQGAYFGWVRITGRGELVGWVRRDAVLPLYGPGVRAGATGFKSGPP